MRKGFGVALLIVAVHASAPLHRGADWAAIEYEGDFGPHEFGWVANDQLQENKYPKQKK